MKKEQNLSLAILKVIKAVTTKTAGIQRLLETFAQAVEKFIESTTFMGIDDQLQEGETCFPCQTR